MGSYIGDLNIVKADVKHVLSHIDKWAKPESIGFSLVWAATRPKIYKEPKGVVLIVRVGRLDRLTVQVGPFNYHRGVKRVARFSERVPWRRLPKAL